MEEKHVILMIAIVLYAIIVYMFSRLGKAKEIGQRRLFVISFFLTPIMGLAFYLSSAHRKLNTYTEASYKCGNCGYVFTENYHNCPFCEKDDKKVKLVKVKKLMT
jgi:hypothetical protein